MSNDAYTQAIEQWRAQMETSLRAEDGWLTLAGLFWLEEGQNLVGSGEDCGVQLPVNSAPERVGVLMRAGSQVRFVAEPGVAVQVNGQSLEEAELLSDSDGKQKPDLVTVGTVTFFVIKRGQRYGIRARDTASPGRQSFEGRDWYPVNTAYRVIGQFTPYDQPTTIAIPNILGDVEQQPSPGFVTFTLAGQQLRLVPTSAGDQLFFVLRDATSGTATYGMGRFLTAAAAIDGQVVLDFNKAYNPPCAFTPYATCPMPPRENILPVAIQAGERYHGEQH